MKNDEIVHLLILHESFNEAERLISILRNAGHPVRAMRIEDGEDLASALEERVWDLMLASPSVADYTAQLAVADLMKAGKDVPCVVVTDLPMEEDKLVSLLRGGVRDVVPASSEVRIRLVAEREIEGVRERRNGRRCERALRESERRARSLTDSSRDAISYVHEGMHIYANPVYVSMFGFQDPDDIQGMPSMDLVAPSDHTKFKEILRQLGKGENPPEEFVFHGLRVDGTEFEATMEFTPASVDGESCTQIIIRDRIVDKDLEKKLKTLSKQDLLTGLFNRQYFIELLEKVVATASPGAPPKTLIYISLDHVAEIKSAVGIAGTDIVLRDIAALLREQLGEKALLARFADQTFTALIGNGKPDDAQGTAQQICRAVEDCIVDVSGRSVTTTCSVGITVVSENSGNAQEVLARADTACASAAEAGGNRVEAYNPLTDSADVDDQDKEKLRLIKKALEEERFHLVYQPIATLHGDSREYYETLIRMTDEDGKTHMPGEFIPAATRAALMTSLDRVVLRHAVSRLAQERGRGTNTAFFVKISGTSVADGTLLAYLAKALEATRLQGDSLVLEITERDAVNHLKGAKTFTEGLKQLHCRCALTQFGSSLKPFNLLKHMEVDFLKFDTSLIKNLTSDEKARDQLQSYVDTAHSLGKLTLAECVDEATTMAALWHCGINYIQGNFIQPPGSELSFDFSDQEG